MPNNIDIDELERLDAEATAGPWVAGKMGLMHPAWVCYHDKEFAKVQYANSYGTLIWAADEYEQKENPDRDVRFRGGEADEKLIAFLRNHVSEIIDILRQK